MKRAKASSLLLFLVLCLVILAAFSTIEARKHHRKKIKMHKNKRSRHGDASLTPAASPLPNSGPPVFNILSFGARANGVSDDSKALLKAWKSACKVTGGIVEIPVGLEFLIKPLTLQGPCRPNLVLQIDGDPFGPFENMVVTKIQFISMDEFQMAAEFHHKRWWHTMERILNSDSSFLSKKKARRIPDIKPTEMIVSQYKQVAPTSMFITSIVALAMALGKDKRVAACVSNILVESIAMRGTLYGARIKTWQGGQGSVKNVTFSDIQSTDVKVPIMIDQYYCDKNVCKNQTGAVSISGVRFNGIRGTYAAQPIHLACSSSVPCIDVELVGVELEPSARYGGFQEAMCWNSYGKTSGRLAPACMDDCVKGGSDVVRRISRSREARCW
ncbi:hypothetical protein SASPL_142640 [Salvia splendens]|uniref:Polygalacturonase n=1 Tax=Salvia splendens TaxID=180675 RepID=A0A8X8WM27_SALSN|nr:hypothetical protein SASPL_142640 [Salvia splendens]